MDSIKLLKAAVLTGAISLSVVACSQKAQDTVEAGAESSSIIGGIQVAGDDSIAKSTVAIVATVTSEDDRQGQFICTGSLLSDNVVLTAGHCVPSEKEYKSAVMYVVFTRDINNTKRSDIRLVTAAAVHPNYGQASDKGADANDVALIRFAGSKADGYQIANVLLDDSVLKQGAVVTLAGFGLNKTDGVNTENDNTLRKTEVQVYDHFGSTEVVLDQTRGKGACHGDSGGPAFVQVGGVQYLWGVTSRGVGQNGVDDCSLVSIYTKVNSQKAFIDSALKTLSQKQSVLSKSEGLDGDAI